VLLVVDDDDAVCRVTARMVTAAGFVVVTATSGDEALRLLKNGYAKAVRLVIADLSMPGMSGPELAERLESALPLLFMSGGTSIQNLPGRCLQKPFSEEGLLREVHRLLA
jgi:two-component system, cell cycle sensor histidine kinase and response regulator CckA